MVSLVLILAFIAGLATGLTWLWVASLGILFIIGVVIAITD